MYVCIFPSSFPKKKNIVAQFVDLGILSATGQARPSFLPSFLPPFLRSMASTSVSSSILFVRCFAW